MQISEADVLEQLQELARQRGEAQAQIYRLDGAEQVCRHQLAKIHERRQAERDAVPEAIQQRLTEVAVNGDQTEG